MKQMIVKKQNDSVRESNKTKNFDKIWKTLLLATSLLLLSAMPVFGWTETVTGLQNAIALTITVGWLKIPLLQTAIP